MDDREPDDQSWRKRKKAMNSTYIEESIFETEKSILSMVEEYAKRKKQVDSRACSPPERQKNVYTNSQIQTPGPCNHPHQYCTSGAEEFLFQDHRERSENSNDDDISSDDDDENRHPPIIQHDTAPIKASRILLGRAPASQRTQENPSSVLSDDQLNVVRHREKLLADILEENKVNRKAVIQGPKRDTPFSLPKQQQQSSPISHSNKAMRSDSTGERHSDQIVPALSMTNEQPADLNSAKEPSQISKPSQHGPDPASFNIQVQLNLPIPEIIITKNTNIDDINNNGPPVNISKTPSVNRNPVMITNQRCQIPNCLPRKITPLIHIEREKTIPEKYYEKAMPLAREYLSSMDLTGQSSMPNNNSILTASFVSQQGASTQTLHHAKSVAATSHHRPQFQERVRNRLPHPRIVTNQSELNVRGYEVHPSLIDQYHKFQMELAHQISTYDQNTFSPGARINADMQSFPKPQPSIFSKRPAYQPFVPVHNNIHTDPRERTRNMNCHVQNRHEIPVNKPIYLTQIPYSHLPAPINERFILQEQRTREDNPCRRSACQCSYEHQIASLAGSFSNRHQLSENTVIRTPTVNNRTKQNLRHEMNIPNKASGDLNYEEMLRHRIPVERITNVRHEDRTHIDRGTQFVSTTDQNSSNTSYQSAATSVIKSINHDNYATRADDFNTINKATQTTFNTIEKNDQRFKETMKTKRDNEYGADKIKNPYTKYDKHNHLPQEFNPYNTRWTLKYQKAEPGLVELMPSSEVYVDEIRLRFYKLKAKSYNKLARLLLTEVFTHNALTVCSIMDPAKVSNLEVSSEKCCLDIHAIMVILKYLHNYGITKHWGVFDRQYTLESMRYKLKELKRKSALN